MEKISYAEFCERMRFHNLKTNEDYDKAITGVIVYKQSNWKNEEPYTEKERSYRVSSANRHFQAGKFSNSLFGYCLDGTDQGVRLDWYNWEPDYCYFD